MPNKPFSILPQTGGVPITKHIVGRDELIKKIWKILHIQGISLFAERRFGKSCVLRKMNANPIPGFITVYKSVQAINTPDDFVECLLDKAKEKNLIKVDLQNSMDKIWNAISQRIDTVKGVKLKSYHKIWQKKLILLLHNLVKSNPRSKIVFFLDEFSIMLDEMQTEDAALVLAILRDIVHDTFPKELRFVYTGSIGIDLIIDKIKLAGHNLGDPLNHMERMRLPVLSKVAAKFFCDCLSLGCNLNISDEIKYHISESADRIPVYIDRIYSIIKENNTITNKTIDEAIFKIINDRDDSTDLDHFYDRIKEYYPNNELSYYILNYLCHQIDSNNEQKIYDKISNEHSITKNQFNDELRRLWNDGYLERIIINEQRHYKFQYEIIRKWWKVNKA